MMIFVLDVQFGQKPCYTLFYVKPTAQKQKKKIGRKYFSLKIYLKAVGGGTQDKETTGNDRKYKL